MKIIVDAFGGDNAPLEIIKGASLAKDELDVEIVLCGDKEKINSVSKENNIDISGFEIIDTPMVFSMEDDPMSILKAKAESSMGVGLKALSEGKGDAFVSAGSTGALVVGATFIVKRIKGIKRAAIASIMPSAGGPFMLIDSGANVDCKPETLVLFGMMGDIYMKKVQNIENPKIALANIGVEETKGTETYVAANKLMRDASYNFIGNIEVRDIPYGGADVIVSDGFTGNVILKMYEGASGMILKRIKTIFKKNLFTKLGALSLAGGLKEFKKTMDYTEFGGAPLMGVTKPVIKAHGSSNAKAIKNAIRQAKAYSEGNVIKIIEENVPKKTEE